MPEIERPKIVLTDWTLLICTYGARKYAASTCFLVASQPVDFRSMFLAGVSEMLVPPVKTGSFDRMRKGSLLVPLPQDNSRRYL